MAYDILICYSSQDKSIADAICHHLETDGLRCWIAPRNIVAGQDWAGAITAALRDVKIVILVYSSYANKSHHIRNELTMALDLGKIIIPFKIEPAELNDSLRYILGPAQWMDAIVPPVESHFSTLSSTVQKLLSNDQPGPGSLPAASSPSKLHQRRIFTLPRIVKWAIGILLLSAIICVSFLYWYPSHVDKALAKSWRASKFMQTYYTAREWEQSPLLRDKSIAAYWRIMAFQSESIRKNEKQNQELDAEYQHVLSKVRQGNRMDDILYQYAHFKYSAKDTQDFRKLLDNIQACYPDSNWKEGIAFYLAQAAALNHDQPVLKKQLVLLTSMPPDSTLYHFESKRTISVREALGILSIIQATHNTSTNSVSNKLLKSTP